MSVPMKTTELKLPDQYITCTTEASRRGGNTHSMTTERIVPTKDTAQTHTAMTSVSSVLSTAEVNSLSRSDMGAGGTSRSLRLLCDAIRGEGAMSTTPSVNGGPPSCSVHLIHTNTAKPRVRTSSKDVATPRSCLWALLRSLSVLIIHTCVTPVV